MINKEGYESLDAVLGKRIASAYHQLLQSKIKRRRHVIILDTRNSAIFTDRDLFPALSALA
jgi:hypothetical protein